MFDVTKPWLKAEKDGEEYVIYTSLPIIPRNQRDISVTTNVDLMTRTDLLNLYPNRFIRTRAAIMYEQNNDLPFDSQLGIILPIEGFTYEQVRENIIKYPHFYQLKRKLGDKFVSFYSNIEINCELHDTLEIWDSLPDSKLISKTTEFIKEYVVRRYTVTLYHLKFSNYLDTIQQSWSAKDTPEQLEYEQIWITTAKVLIISNLDYVQFKDFQAQTLLNIIHNRLNAGLTTIVVCPKINTLVGSGMFFQRLLSMLREAVVR